MSEKKYTKAEVERLVSEAKTKLLINQAQTRQLAKKNNLIQIRSELDINNTNKNIPDALNDPSNAEKVTKMAEDGLLKNTVLTGSDKPPDPKDLKLDSMWKDLFGENDFTDFMSKNGSAIAEGVLGGLSLGAGIVKASDSHKANRTNRRAANQAMKRAEESFMLAKEDRQSRLDASKKLNAQFG